MSAKAKAMMERLNKNNVVLDNSKPQDLDVIFALFNTNSCMKYILTKNFYYKIQDERQVRLREHARRLIAETRARSHNLDSPTSPLKATHRKTMSPERTISPINTSDGLFSTIFDSKESSPVQSGDQAIENSTGSRRSSPSKGNTSNERNGNSPLQSFNSVLDRISPLREKKVRTHYIQLDTLR